MLISWLYEQVKRGVDKADQDLVVGLGIELFIIGLGVSISIFWVNASYFGAIASILFVIGVSAFIAHEEKNGNVPAQTMKTITLNAVAFVLYLGLMFGLIAGAYPLGLPLLGIIIIGEEAIFWIDPQKRPSGVGVLTFTTLKKLDAVNDVFIGLGAYGLVYEITGGIKPAIKFFNTATPVVAVGIIIIGGGMALLLLNSLKYGGPHAPEPKTETG